MAYKGLDSVTSSYSSHWSTLGSCSPNLRKTHQNCSNLRGCHSGDMAKHLQKHPASGTSFSLHQMMYYGCYEDFGPDPPAWIPDPEYAVFTNVGQLLERHGKEFLGSRYKDPILSFSDFQDPPNIPGIGELALGPFIFGSSSTPLNGNHFNVYFKEMPTWNGKVLRRHGDVFERTSKGYYHAHGRADDTMNLGGIKVSSVEIERIYNAVNGAVYETAAIGVPPQGA